MNHLDQLRIADYLDHILEAIERVFRYIAEAEEFGFSENDMLQDAVLRNFEVIGEAARNLVRHYPEFAAEHSEIPWQLMYYMRNRISHGYFSVDFEIVWRTVEVELPGIQLKIKKLSERYK